MSVYRLLLRLLPRDRRDRHGAQMHVVFAEQRAAARREGGPVAETLLWIRETAGLFRFSMRDRAERLGSWLAARLPSGWDRGPSAVSTELRWAWRGLRARGALRVSLIVGLLGVALAANMLLFAAADSLVFHRFPYRDPERLIGFESVDLGSGRIWGGPAGGIGYALPPALLEEWRGSTNLLAGLHGCLIGQYTFVMGGDQPARIETAFVTPGLPEMLGWTVKWGRPIVDADARDTTTRPVLIGEQLARDRFGDPARAVGRRLETDDDPLLIVGVMPRGFTFPDVRYRIWRPLDLHAAAINDRDVYGVGRLADGVTVDALAAWVAGRLRASPVAGVRANTTVRPFPLKPAQPLNDTERALVLMVGAALCLLLIACANVASVELAGAMARVRTSTIQIALGASRAGLVRTAALEGALLVGTAAAVAIGLAWVGLHVLTLWLPQSLLRASANPVDLDIRTFVFMTAIAAATWIVSSLPAALYTSRPDLVGVLKLEGQTTATSGRAARVRRVLTVAEVALTVLLLVAGTLYARSYLAIVSVEKGFNTTGLALVDLTFPLGTYSSDAARTSVVDEILRRLRARPDVKAITRTAPFQFNMTESDRIEVAGRSAPADALDLAIYTADDGFFSTFGVPMRSGRPFQPGEPPDHVVIGETLARRIWPNGNAVGQHFRVGPKAPWQTVVGVVGHVRNDRDPPGGLSSRFFEMYTAPQPRVVRPARPIPPPPSRPRPNLPGGALFAFQTFAIRMDPPSHIGDVFQTIRSIDSRFRLTVTWIDDVYAERYADRLLTMRVIGGFGILAFLVAMAGIYGVMAFLVAGRTREIGIRVTLGADRVAISRLVLGSSMRLVAIGTALGLAGAFTASRWVASQLFGVTPTDPATYALVAVTVVITAMLATWQPARQAASIDPAITLRAE